jgi:hypothetical protein
MIRDEIDEDSAGPDASMFDEDAVLDAEDAAGAA